MKLKEKVIICNHLEELPDFKSIKSFQAGIEWKIIFGESIAHKRKKIGSRWRFEHPEFEIGIHTTKPEIYFTKLITDQEIEKHQDFFEQCAKDYRNLATQLINMFAHTYQIKIDPEFPNHSLYHTNTLGYEPVGQMNHWRYAFHGIHCAFTHNKTGQYIEVPLTYGLEFGVLDPYFFTKFIKSTKAYYPLPVNIYSCYTDGKKILDKMLDLGKFEYINSNWPDKKGIVVTDREKTMVKTYKPTPHLKENKQNLQESKQTFLTKIKNWFS